MHDEYQFCTFNLHSQIHHRNIQRRKVCLLIPPPPPPPDKICSRDFQFSFPQESSFPRWIPGSGYSMLVRNPCHEGTRYHMTGTTWHPQLGMISPFPALRCTPYHTLPTVVNCSESKESQASHAVSPLTLQFPTEFAWHADRRHKLLRSKNEYPLRIHSLNGTWFTVF